MLLWLSEAGKIWGFQAFWSCSVEILHYGGLFVGWNWSYLGFLGIIWRTCGSKCQGEGGGIFPTLCVECCLVILRNSGISPCSKIANMFHITGPFGYGCWYFFPILSSRRPIISYSGGLGETVGWRIKCGNFSHCTFVCGACIFVHLNPVNSLIASRNAFWSIALYELLPINTSEYS